ncbi:SGNH/GDSL hydrolase family protein, partial [Gelidibacter sp.]|uniref:SGNH/GDSL hydrolase family protein n=1 Tax=Gelidibacter sp. TaxID=2018083 RepID=UPI003262F567
QATAGDLFVLPVSSLIPLGYGTQFPLEDKWVLLPSEQDEVANAIAAFNSAISATASEAGLAFVDANALYQQLANGGITTGNFKLTSQLVLGGAIGLDGVHPTARGYAFIANMFMRAIDTTYGSTFEASGNFVDVGDYPTNYPATLQ